MNCREALSRLYEVIDNESADIDTKELNAHLEKCGPCLKQYRLEEAVNKLLRHKFNKATESECCSDSCRRKILDQIKAAELEEEQKSAESRSSFRIWRTTLAAAASLIVLLGIGYVSYQLYQHNKYYIPIERLHWAAEDHPENFTQANFASAMVSVQQQFDYLMQENVGSFNLIGSKVDSLAGLAMEHFLYSNDTTTVSVFVVDAHRFELPPDIAKARVERAGKEYFDHNCRGCRVVYHNEGNAMIITASTDHSIDLPDFAPGRLGI